MLLGALEAGVMSVCTPDVFVTPILLAQPYIQYDMVLKRFGSKWRGSATVEFSVYMVLNPFIRSACILRNEKFSASDQNSGGTSAAAISSRITKPVGLICAVAIMG
jgi:hypothetical protein